MKLYLLLLLYLPIVFSMRAYIYSENNEDQREPHNTGRNKTEDDLAKFGVLYWKIHDSDPLDRLDEIAKRRNYNHRQTMELSPDAFGSVYEDKIKEFFTERTMEGEEARYILDGSAYFDVRDKANFWIRIALEERDLIILPKGIHYRSTTDEKNYVKAMRLNTI